MKIAILGPAHPWRGGIAHYSARLYRAIEAAGHQPILYNFRRLYPALLFPGKSQKDPSAAPYRVPDIMILDPTAPRSWLKFGRAIAQDRPDRLVLQWWHPFFAPAYAAACKAARQAGIQTIMLCHNVAPHEPSPVDRALLKLAYAAPERFLVQSSAEAARLRALVGPDAPIQITPHPPYDIFDDAQDTAPLSKDAARARYGITHQYSLLFFGLIRPYKGLDTLLHALNRVPDTLDVGLKIVGEVYGDRRPYLELIERLGLSQRVTLDDRYAPNEEIPAIFAAADACILPYKAATGSGVANIALAHQTPLVMSALPTLQDAFPTHPVTWFEPANPAALAHAITQTLQNPPPPTTPTHHSWRAIVDAIAA